MKERIDLINYFYSKWNKLSDDIKIKKYRNSFERFLCEQPLMQITSRKEAK